MLSCYNFKTYVFSMFILAFCSPNSSNDNSKFIYIKKLYICVCVCVYIYIYKSIPFILEGGGREGSQSFIF